ncbi:MAG: glycosyltransferase family 2 protein [Anaerolinea sp.]|nr:glycosyltransferase family 2 protein [Anaerolinea sp.]
MKNVSIIIPCLNEEGTISKTLSGIIGQSYPTAMMEVIIADGLSTDGTRTKISKFQHLHPELQIFVIDNPKRTIPAGLNLAIQAATGETIIRLDAHSISALDYIEKCVAALEANKGDNVGGVWDIQPVNQGWVAKSIAKAAASKLGVGDANYRLKTGSGPVDTVPFGAFRKATLDRLGGYDESLLTNEDYELNTRIRKQGGIVWLDSSIQCTYFARATFSELGRQYWRYGFWKAQMLKRYPGTIRWRQALPPAFVLGLIGSLFLSIFQPAFLFIFSTVISIYMLVLLAHALNIALKNRFPAFIIGIPVAIFIMHILWGSGMVAGVLSNPKPKNLLH